MLFRESETIELKEVVVDDIKREIVALDIQRGTDRPYYLAKKGMCPEGVYVRQGYSSVPATDTAIRRMIKETDGDRFEAMRCLNQELTFEAAKKEFTLRQVEFGPQQMNEAYDFIDFRNQTRATIEKLLRIDAGD